MNQADQASASKTEEEVGAREPETLVANTTGDAKSKSRATKTTGRVAGVMFPTLVCTVAPEPSSPRAADFKPLSADSKAISASTAVTTEDKGNPKSRSLILTGSEEDVAGAVRVLQQMDVAPPQVLIEARLVEISPEKSKNLGLLYEFSHSTFQELRTPRGTAGGPDLGDHGLNFGRFIRTPFDIDVTLNALQENRDARLLANPRISVIDGEDASIFIGDLLRFRVLQSVTSGGNEQFTVQEVPVGIALLVRPRVHSDGNVTLKVHPVVSTVTSFVGPERIPQTATREADSTIRMKDGETVVIGGLMREEDITIMSKVPGLGDLPLIGKLFQNKNSSKRKSEVTVFLTARIMR
jgi:type II secretory pathway component GspD/PulD (secretin)